MKNMSKKNAIIVLIVVVLVVGFGFWFKKTEKSDAYSVVYLTTGEVYVGKLTTFPDFQLKDSYILQIAKDATDATKTNFQLQPINQARWATDVIHINKDNVVFYGPLSDTSSIAKTLAEKKGQ